jgi:hypothetical protein
LNIFEINIYHISDRLEKVQTEAARIVTGLTSYASLDSIYCETGWEKLTVRREVNKLNLYYDDFVDNSYLIRQLLGVSTLMNILGLHYL